MSSIVSQPARMNVQLVPLDARIAARRLRRIAAGLGTLLPRLTSHAAAMSDLASGYEAMAASAEARGDQINARMFRECAAAVRAAIVRSVV